MALILGLGHLAAVLAVLFLSAAFGSRVLERSGLPSAHPLEHILFSAGAGFACLQIALFFLMVFGGLRRTSVIALLAVMALAAGKHLLLVGGLFRKWAGSALRSRRPRLEIACVWLACAWLIAGALLALAPVSGSDALHYHFNAPRLQAETPGQPVFAVVNSFFTGQAHLLIGLGFALGSSQISMEFIFLGGCLSAAALFQLSRQWMPRPWAFAVALTFIATPMVFWQMSVAGAPDIWMGFYVLLAVLAAGRGSETRHMPWMTLAGVFSGAAAGVKYTGWIVPAAVVVYVLVAARSWKWAAACASAALAAGVWPQARNFIWTGDAFFPFLGRWMGRGGENAFTLAAVLADTHSEAFSPSPAQILRYPMGMVLRGDSYGVGHYFGPVLLAFAPLLIFACWKSRTGRLAGAIWLAMFLVNALSTQMARFLLPVFPIALALAFSGAAAAVEKGWRLVRAGCFATLGVFLVFCAAADAAYSRDFLPAALGIEGRNHFLERMAPDYQIAEYVNAVLLSRRGRAMVFFRHLYYLRAPYINGDPATSWVMNPQHLQAPDSLLQLLNQLDVKWVVKTPGYPPAIAAAFEDLERRERLIPVLSGEVTDFSGRRRLEQQKSAIRVTVLAVVP